MQKFSAAFSYSDVRILEKDTVYQGAFRIDKYRLRYRQFNGEWSKPVIREVFERGDAVAVLPYDPIQNKVVLIEQFRAGALNRNFSPWLFEIVAGIINIDEKPEHVAARETQEEVGLEILDLMPICDYMASPGGSSEKVSVFCGKVKAHKTSEIHGLIDEGEDIRTHVIDTTHAYKALANGQISHAAAIVALQWLKLNEKQVRERWNKKD